MDVLLVRPTSPGQRRIEIVVHVVAHGRVRACACVEGVACVSCVVCAMASPGGPCCTGAMLIGAEPRPRSELLSWELARPSALRLYRALESLESAVRLHVGTWDTLALGVRPLRGGAELDFVVRELAHPDPEGLRRAREMVGLQGVGRALLAV